MGALGKMFSGKAARQGMMKAEMDAAQKRKALEGLDEESEAQKAKRRMRDAAAQRGGVASTRLASDTILGGTAPLG